MLGTFCSVPLSDAKREWKLFLYVPPTWGAIMHLVRLELAGDYSNHTEGTLLRHIPNNSHFLKFV